MRHIRLASEAEIEAIKDKSDILPGGTQVFAWDNDKGEADLAVVRNCWELNPVVYAPSTNDYRRAKFLFALEERMLGAGVDRYYFQIDSSDEHYRKVVQAWGAQEVSPHPETRYLKVIS